MSSLILAATLLVPVSPGTVLNQTNTAADPTNTAPKAAFAAPSPSLEDPEEVAYHQVLAADDAAQEDMDRWIREADAQGADADTSALQARINAAIAQVAKAYETFLAKHPNHPRARIAYGSFLNDTGQEDAARNQWEKAMTIDPKNPAIYNNLAGIYGHHGPIAKAFEYFEKAIELEPRESVYYQNLATSVFLFRRDALAHYGFTDEQRVFDKALELYVKAMELDPKNFVLAADTAQTYYGINPPRYDSALAAWQKALALAGDDLEREGIRVHVARVQVQAGRTEAARATLSTITNSVYLPVKEKIAATLERRLQGEKGASKDEDADLLPTAAPIRYPDGKLRGNGR